MEDSHVYIDSKINQKEPAVYISSSKPVQNTEDSHSKGGNFLTTGIHTVVTFFLDFIETIVVALSIFVVVYLFLVQPHEVKGTSMEPSFHNNEYILTDKITYRFQEPKRGDVVIFKSPGNPDVDYIKRIIGLPGERVKVEGGYVYINENKLPEVYLKDLTALSPGDTMKEGQEITIPPNQLLVLGDNRPHSSDSRAFGPIDRNSVIGRAIVRYWPLPEFGLVPQVTY